jgi:hypothetical protein
MRSTLTGASPTVSVAASRAITLGTQIGDKSVDLVHKSGGKRWTSGGCHRPFIRSSATCHRLSAHQTHPPVNQTHRADLRQRTLSTLSTTPTTTTNYVFITTPQSVITSPYLLIQPTT